MYCIHESTHCYNYVMLIQIKYIISQNITSYYIHLLSCIGTWINTGLLVDVMYMTKTIHLNKMGCPVGLSYPRKFR